MAKASSAAARERANPLATAEVPLYVATELLGAAPGVFRVRLKSSAKVQARSSRGTSKCVSTACCACAPWFRCPLRAGSLLEMLQRQRVVFVQTCSPSFEFFHNLTVELRSTARLLTQLFAFELQLGLRRKSHGFRRNLRFNRCNCRFF